ncbi:MULTISPECIES: phenylalanine--tRNA ligase subunit beta [Methylotenera]|uniref:phenylalanine--tRNA ligase subunit beta n=1 Tax=Methylotenera TaxID=359407 RepID=UPI00036072C1|nr:MULTISPECIES: phenylalanine--tRNA ligase subunit beta [Methylotenera]
MQFSENWLRAFVNPAMSSTELSHALTMAGLEVEEMTPVAPAFGNIVIGEIIEAIKHPDADRLQVCKVNVGKEPLQIVCGASNARVGLKVPCALVGAELPSISIKQAKVRGVESFGMLCSAKELGLAAEANGLLELPDDATAGQDIREYLNLNDYTLTLKLTPNRTDCLSILGIARDVTAITGAPITLPVFNTVAVESAKSLAVKVTASEACPAYYGRVIEGVNAQANTPDWMIRNLERSGVRSISAIVDITNYVLLELGQPMHAFDLATLNGGVNVRFAAENEQVKLLNNTEVKLASDDLVIADNNGAIALAGIMGGEPTSVTDATTAIFLESAFFTPDAIAGKARRLGLSTDSSYRFERGVDFGNTKLALERATGLVLQICGGKAGELTEVVNQLPERVSVTLRYSRLCSVLGITIPKQTVGTLLTQLGFKFTEENNLFVIKAPTYRFDIAREEDLIEEIARLHGYDKIPAIIPTAHLNMLNATESVFNTNWLHDALQAQGYQEIISYSFVDESWERDLLGNTQPIKLKNPIASNLSVMRSGLWGGLLDTLTYNINRKQERAMLFEIGSSYHAAPEGFNEQARVAGLFYGAFQPEQWGAATKDVDFYDIKATVEKLTHGNAEYRAETHSALHPGQSARIYLDGQPIGWLGKLHPKWQQHYSLVKNCFLFELEVLPLLKKSVASYLEVPKTLAIRRDLAVIVDINEPVQVILNAVTNANIPLVTQVQLFDIYQGKGIPENKKSLALSVLMQDTHKTLVDIEAEAAMAQLLKLLENQFGASLRN